MNPETVLITGSNRGIGLQLVKDYLNSSEPPKAVIAACRNPDDAKALQDLKASFGNLKLLKLDLVNDLDESSMNRVKEEVEKMLGGLGLNLLINNAGVMPDIWMKNVNIESLTSSFKVNTFGPLLLCKALMPLLKKAVNDTDKPSMNQSGVANITSSLGSIKNCRSPHYIIYNGSKAALNMFNKNLALEYGKEGILFLAIHPGGVDTDMSKKAMEQSGNIFTPISTAESSQGIMTVMSNATGKDQGKFLSYTGEELPW